MSAGALLPDTSPLAKPTDGKPIGLDPAVFVPEKP